MQPSILKLIFIKGTPFIYPDISQDIQIYDFVRNYEDDQNWTFENRQLQSQDFGAT